MKFPRSRLTLLCLIPVLFVAIFYACGGGTNITVSPTSGTTLPVTDSTPIIVTFSNGVDPTSLVLGGNMATWSDGGTWSSDNKTLTITPTDTWDASALGTLTIDVNETGGKPLETVELEYPIIITFTTFQEAEVVIGQSDFTDDGFGLTSSTFTSPYGTPSFADGKLFLPDWSNNRTLIFNSVPTSNGKHANVVVGQEDFTSNDPELDADGSGGPVTVQAYNGKLFVLDYGNNALYIYNTIPTSNGEAADVIIGQSDFDLGVGDCKNNRLDSPESFIIVDGKLIIADSDNNRVLIWNTIPEENNVAADVVVGQDSFTACTANDDDQDDADDGQPTSRTLDFPSGVWSDGTKLVVGDESNNRVLIWNTFPTSNFERADVVLGQSDFTKNTSNDDNQDGADDGNASSRTLYDPYDGIWSNGTQLFVADSSNNRVLIWNTFPTENFERADVVIGQSDFSHITNNDDDQDDAADGSPSARTMNYPAGLLIFGNHLILPDESNNRYLIFNGQSTL